MKEENGGWDCFDRLNCSHWIGYIIPQLLRIAAVKEVGKSLGMKDMRV